MKHQVLSLKPTGNVANHVAATKNLPNSHAAVISKKTMNSTGCLVASIYLKIAEKTSNQGMIPFTHDSSDIPGHYGHYIYPLVNIQTTMENHHLYSIKMHPQKKQRQD